MDRVLIACVTFDINKITSSAEEYLADRIYLLCDCESAEYDTAGLYKAFCDETADRIREISTHPEIIGRCLNPYDYPLLLKQIESIVEEENLSEPNPAIYINISAGTPEFASAATVISMFHDNVTLFSINSKEFMKEEFSVMKHHLDSRDGGPVGFSIDPPNAIIRYKENIPRRNLVIGLRIFSEMGINDRRAKDVIERLKESNVWMREDKVSNEHVYYLRDFIERWLEYGWIAKCDGRDSYRITDTGKVVIDTFYRPRADIIIPR